MPFKHRILLLALIRKSYLIILALVWGWGGGDFYPQQAHVPLGCWTGRCSQLSCSKHHPSSVVTGLLLVREHLLMVLMVSDDFTQHVNDAA